MPRYIIERTFPEGIEIPTNGDGQAALRGIVDNNTAEQVSWVHSYVTQDHRKTFCVYDGATPESIRRAAERSGVPVDSISEVSVLDPYFYVGNTA